MLRTSYSETRLSHGRRLADLGRAISPTPVVRGRDAELASIGVQLDRVRSGAGAVLLVEGEPGMGKTRLLAEGARVARRLAFRVGVGAADPGAGVVELAPLMTALFDGSSPLLERAGLRELHSLPEQRYWLLQDLQAMLERAALRGPLLILLDDLQWADSGTASALRALPVHLADMPVAWFLAFRPGQGSGQLLSGSSSVRSLTTPWPRWPRTSSTRSPTTRCWTWSKARAAVRSCSPSSCRALGTSN
jgi:hypothetical protein